MGFKPHIIVVDVYVLRMDIFIMCYAISKEKWIAADIFYLLRIIYCSVDFCGKAVLGTVLSLILPKTVSVRMCLYWVGSRKCSALFRCDVLR